MSMEQPQVANATPILQTLQIHKLHWKISREIVPHIEFFKPSRGKQPYFPQCYRNDKDPFFCGHKNENLDENTRAYCQKVFDDKETEEQLRWPLCEN